MEGNRDFHLTEEKLDVAEVIIKRTTKPKQQSIVLIGSLKSLRPFNSYALNSTMKSARRVGKGFTFREISTNLFSFQFCDENDKNRILKTGPWSFDKSLLILREPENEEPTKMKFDHSQFWVRFYDLPISMNNKESIGILIE